jgi:hypothetical protein
MALTSVGARSRSSECPLLWCQLTAKLNAHCPLWVGSRRAAVIGQERTSRVATSLCGWSPLRLRRTGASVLTRGGHCPRTQGSDSTRHSRWGVHHGATHSHRGGNAAYPLEQREADRAEGAFEGEGYLGDSRPPPESQTEPANLPCSIWRSTGAMRNRGQRFARQCECLSLAAFVKGAYPWLGNGEAIAGASEWRSGDGRDR